MKKRRFLCLALTMAMAAALTGCGNKDAEVSNGANPEVVTQEVQESADAVELTQEELDSFTELFQTTEYDGFLVQPFRNVGEIEWGEVLYCGAGIGASDISEEEKNAFYKELGYGEEDGLGDLEVLRASDIADYAQSHAGVNYEDFKDDIGYTYLEKYDSYYTLQSDSNYISFTCKEGKKLDDLYVITMTNDLGSGDGSDAYDYPNCVVTFQKNGDVYKMISNQWLWEVGNDPDQTFDIQLPGHDEPGRLVTYQGDSATGDGAHIIITAEGKRVDSLGTWFWTDNETQDFTKINAVGMFDFSADGVQDIVVIAEDATGKAHVGLYQYNEDFDLPGYGYLSDASNWITEYYSEDLTIPNVKEYLLVDNKSGTYSSWKEAYQQVVKISNLEGDFSYNLIYVDDDDIPELVVDSEGYYINLYSFKDGQAIPLERNFGYGAAGIGGYDYAPKKNCVKFSDADYAGLTCSINYMGIVDNRLRMIYYCNIDNYDDLDGNGYPSEDEMTEEALAKAKGSISFSAADKSLSEAEIEKCINELDKYDFEAINGKYDSVDFYDVIQKL